MISVPQCRNPSSREAAFVASLELLFRRENRAALAALRRGFGKEPWEAPEMYPFVVPHFTAALTVRAERAFFVTASAFAQHPSSGAESEPSTGRPNLGRALRQSIRSPEQGAGTERRFVALLRADEEDLTEHLWRSVTLLKSREVEMDWRQFLHDIARSSWDRVRREWAASFWVSIEEDCETAAEPREMVPETESTI